MQIERNLQYSKLNVSESTCGYQHFKGALHMALINSVKIIGVTQLADQIYKITYYCFEYDETEHNSHVDFPITISDLTFQ